MYSHKMARWLNCGSCCPSIALVRARIASRARAQFRALHLSANGIVKIELAYGKDRDDGAVKIEPSYGALDNSRHEYFSVLQESADCS